MQKEQRIEGGMDLFSVRGYSMWPFLNEGSKVVVKRKPFSEIGVGDIVLYRQKDAVVCHRVVRTSGKGAYMFLHCRGDNSNSKPDVVSCEEYVGKVVAVVKNGRERSTVNKVSIVKNVLIVFIAPLLSCSVKLLKRCLHKG